MGDQFVNPQLVTNDRGISVTVWDDVPDAGKGSHYLKAPDQLEYPPKSLRFYVFPGAQKWWYTIVAFNPAPWRMMLPTGGNSIKVPDAFLDLFGPIPKSDGTDWVKHHAAIQEWRQQLSGWKGLGVPAWVRPADLEDASRRTNDWDLGVPTTFDGLYGWTARFRGSPVPDYDMPLRFLVDTPIQAIVAMQTRMIHRGIRPTRPHPDLSPNTVKEMEKL